MTISKLIREQILIVLTPVPYLLILTSILSFTSGINSLLFLFVFSLTMSFFYLLIARGFSSIRSNLTQRKKSIPDPDDEYQGDTPVKRFISITREVWFGGVNDIESITEYTSRSPFPYLVYSFWGFIVSFFSFIFSGAFLAWLVSSGFLDSKADLPIPEDAIQNAPLGLVDFLFSLFPMFNRLSFEDQIVIGGVTFFTGFMFLTTARNLTEVSDDFHRRVLKFLVSQNPLTKNELLNIILLLLSYSLLFFLI